MKKGHWEQKIKEAYRQGVEAGRDGGGALDTEELQEHGEFVVEFTQKRPLKATSDLDAIGQAVKMAVTNKSAVTLTTRSGSMLEIDEDGSVA